MLSAKEREERKHQIGASEIYILLNFDSQTCQNLWELKVGLQDYQEFSNSAIDCGNILEEDCLKYYEKTNKTKLIYNERIESKQIKGLVVSLDSREYETNIPVENKVINIKTWKKWIAKKKYNAEYQNIKLNVPISYYCQIQTQMYVLGTKIGILNINTLTDEEQQDPINVIISDSHNKQIKIIRDDFLINDLKNRAIFMLDCMNFKKRPSEIDYLEKYLF